MTVDIYSYTVIIVSVMKKNEQYFTLNELATLVELPRRTVRYYIQIELIDRPKGLGRGSHYTSNHLEQLIEIRKWQRAGLSLERIRELMEAEDKEIPLPPRPRKKGSIEIRSHVMISDGVELAIEPKRSGLTPEQTRKFAEGVINLYEQILNRQEK